MPATFPANPAENDVIQLNQNKYIYRGGVWRILREPENEVVRNIFYTSDSRKLHSIDKETSLLFSFEKPTISDSSIYNRSISNTTNLPSISRHGAYVSGSEEIFAEPINYFLNDDFTISFDMFSQNDKDFDIMSFSTGSDNLGSITYADTNGFSIGGSNLSGSDSFINNSWNTFVITHESYGDFNLYRDGEFVASASHDTFPITTTQGVAVNNFKIAFSPTQNDYFIRNIKFHDKILTEQQIKDYDPYQNNTGATHYYPLRITTNNNTYLKDLAGSVDMQASSGVIEGKNIAGTGGAYFDGSNNTRIDIDPTTLGATRITNQYLDYYQLDYSSLTIEAWVYLDVNITGNLTYYPIFGNTGHRSGSALWYGHHSLFGVAEKDSRLVLVTLGNYQRDGKYYYATSLELQPRQWHHVAVCVGPQGRMLFLDGVREQDTTTNYWPKTRYYDDFYVGKGQYFYGQSTPWAYFKGWMDDFRISNSVKYNSSFTPPARHKIFQGNTQSRTKALPYVPLKVIKDNDYYDIESNNRNWFLRRGYSQNEVFNSPQITNNGEEFYRRSSVFPNSYTSGLVASRPSGSTETKLLFIDSEGVMQDLTPVNEVEIGDIAELEPLQSTGSLPEGKYILFASGSDIYYRDKNNTTYKINTET